MLIDKFSVKIERKRSKHLIDEYVRFHFTSKRKRMSTIISSVGKTEYGYDKRIHMKGAAEYIIDSCSHYLD